MALFLKHFLLDQVTELKRDCFYGGLPEQFKVMAAYLKEGSNERTYSDYLWAAQEAEKEEVMEASHNLPMASTSRAKAMSFFPLWKLKGSEPAITSSMWVVNLEEESADKEEYINGNDPDGIRGLTEEFIICLTRAVKDAQQTEKCCYHCGSPDHFICDCPLLAGAQADQPLNWREGMKGAWVP